MSHSELLETGALQLADPSSSGSDGGDSDSGELRRCAWSGSLALLLLGVTALAVTALFVALMSTAAGVHTLNALGTGGTSGSWLLPRAALRFPFGAGAAAPARSAQQNETWMGEVARGKEFKEIEGSVWSHYARDCWIPCGGAGLCEDWCGTGRACCRFLHASDPPECRNVHFWPSLTYHTCVAAADPDPAGPADATGSSEVTSTTTPAPTQAPEAPVFQFYLYRAQNDENTYTLGNVNIANLPGVMWYLSNEVMPRCPRRYGIGRIRRYLITTRATPELYARGMNFGVRYSYDAGRCTGSNIRWLGPCSDTWDRFGYVPGCNNFRDHYPYPLFDTEYPDGVWYDLPLDGRCDSPTGAWNCTWSFEEAGEIRLEELEENEPGYGYCCGGKCTDFWRGHWTASECDRRLTQVRDLFAKRFPDLPREMPHPKCDFDRTRFWD